MIGVCIVVMALGAYSAWRLSKSRSFQLFGGMVDHVETLQPTVALTFDDGPVPGYTEEVLAILHETGVRATFLVVGQSAEQNTDQAQQIVAEGHELGNHSYSHQHMIGRSYAFVRDEIERTDELIRAAGYRGDIHFRPPYGKRLIILPYYLWVTGRSTLYFDVEPESYAEVARDADHIVEHMLDNASPGSIILLHVMARSRSTTREALPRIIDGLLAQGYTFVTVSELLALDQ